MFPKKILRKNCSAKGVKETKRLVKQRLSLVHDVNKVGSELFTIIYKSRSSLNKESKLIKKSTVSTSNFVYSLCDSEIKCPKTDNVVEWKHSSLETINLLATQLETIQEKIKLLKIHLLSLSKALQSGTQDYMDTNVNNKEDKKIELLKLSPKKEDLFFSSALVLPVPANEFYRKLYDKTINDPIKSMEWQLEILEFQIIDLLLQIKQRVIVNPNYKQIYKERIVRQALSFQRVMRPFPNINTKRKTIKCLYDTAIISQPLKNRKNENNPIFSFNRPVELCEKAVTSSNVEKSLFGWNSNMFKNILMSISTTYFNHFDMNLCGNNFVKDDSTKLSCCSFNSNIMFILQICKVIQHNLHNTSNMAIANYEFNEVSFELSPTKLFKALQKLINFYETQTSSSLLSVNSTFTVVNVSSLKLLVIVIQVIRFLEQYGFLKCLKVVHHNVSKVKWTYTIATDFNFSVGSTVLLSEKEIISNSKIKVVSYESKKGLHENNTILFPKQWFAGKQHSKTYSSPKENLESFKRRTIKKIKSKAFTLPYDNRVVRKSSVITSHLNENSQDLEHKICLMVTTANLSLCADNIFNKITPQLVENCLNTVHNGKILSLPGTKSTQTTPCSYSEASNLKCNLKQHTKCINKSEFLSLKNTFHEKELLFRKNVKDMQQNIELTTPQIKKIYLTVQQLTENLNSNIKQNAINGKNVCEYIYLLQNSFKSEMFVITKSMNNLMKSHAKQHNVLNSKMNKNCNIIKTMDNNLNCFKSKLITNIDEQRLMSRKLCKLNYKVNCFMKSCTLNVSKAMQYSKMCEKNVNLKYRATFCKVNKISHRLQYDIKFIHRFFNEKINKNDLLACNFNKLEIKNEKFIQTQQNTVENLTENVKNMQLFLFQGISNIFENLESRLGVVERGYAHYYTNCESVDNKINALQQTVIKSEENLKKTSKNVFALHNAVLINKKLIGNLFEEYNILKRNLDIELRLQHDITNKINSDLEIFNRANRHKMAANKRFDKEEVHNFAFTLKKSTEKSRASCNHLNELSKQMDTKVNDVQAKLEDLLVNL